MAAHKGRTFALGGAVLGTVLGYVAGPTIPLVGGHLPLGHVLTLGSSMQGLDGVMLGGLAAQAGLLLYGGALVFAGVGFAVGR